MFKCVEQNSKHEQVFRERAVGASSRRMRAEPTCEQYRDEPVSDVPVTMDDQSTTSAEQSAVMPQGRLNLGGITDMYIFALSHGRWLGAFFIFSEKAAPEAQSYHYHIRRKRGTYESCKFGWNKI